MVASPRTILFKAQEGKCFYCGAYLKLRRKNDSTMHNKKKDARPGTLDHFIPTSREGLKELSNCVFACEDCNTKKGNRMPTRKEWQMFKELHHKVLDELERSVGT